MPKEAKNRNTDIRRRKLDIAREDADTVVRVSRHVLMGNDLAPTPTPIGVIPQTTEIPIAPDEILPASITNPDSYQITKVEELASKRAQAAISVDKYIKSLNGPTSQDVRLVRAIKSSLLAQASQPDSNVSLLDKTTDNIGIFKTRNPEARVRISTFLRGVEASLVALAQRTYPPIKTHEVALSANQIAKFAESIIPNTVIKSKQNEQAESQQDTRKEDFASLAELAMAVGSVLDPDSNSHKFNGQGSRYRMVDKGWYYMPHNPSVHNKSFLPINYDAALPANINFKIEDSQTGRDLSITFFPMTYALYKGFKAYDGLDPERARELITKRRLRGWNNKQLDDAHDLQPDDVVNEALKTYKPSSVSLSLSEKGRKIAELHGEYKQTEGENKQDVVYGYSFTTPLAPDFSAFVEMGHKPARTELDSEDDLRGFPLGTVLVKNLVNCDIRF